MLVYNSIILSAGLVGSVFLCSTSLTLINMAHIENKKTPKEIIILNGLTYIISGSLVIFTFNALYRLRPYST